LQNKDITLYGDGNQTRSFCYVSDLLDGILRLMNAPEDFIGPVNIGNPRESTIRELAEMVLQLTGSKSELVFMPLPADDPRQRQPDISLARTKLDWEPKVAVEDGLKETIAYFRHLLAE
jgi:UDP-glucuronate decarboxylase